MLRGLPNNEQSNGNNNNGEQHVAKNNNQPSDVAMKDQGFHEVTEQPNVLHVHSTSSSPTHGTTHPSDGKHRVLRDPSCHLDLANAPLTDARPPLAKRPQCYAAGDAEYAQIYKTTSWYKAWYKLAWNARVALLNM